MTTQPASGYRSASAFATCAPILLVAEALVSAAAALSDAYQIRLLDMIRFDMPIPPDLTEAQDVRQRLLAGLEVGVSLPALIVFLAWVYRASRNARALGAEGMKYTPGWSVGWFFVPFANLVLPYLVMREIWQASRAEPGLEWRQSPISPVLGVWGVLRVARGIIQYGPLPVLFGERSLADMSLFGANWANVQSNFYWGSLIAHLVSIALCVLTVVVVIRITDLQELRRLRIELIARSVVEQAEEGALASRPVLRQEANVPGSPSSPFLRPSLP